MKLENNFIDYGDRVLYVSLVTQYTESTTRTSFIPGKQMETYLTPKEKASFLIVISHIYNIFKDNDQEIFFGGMVFGSRVNKNISIISFSNLFFRSLTSLLFST